MKYMQKLFFVFCFVSGVFAVACNSSESAPYIETGGVSGASLDAGASSTGPITSQTGGTVNAAGGVTAQGGKGASGKSGAGAKAGVGGKKATGGKTAGTGGKGGAGAAGKVDLGKGDGTDVVTIGDSWMNIMTNGMGIEGALDRAGTSYRHYAVAGTKLLDEVIPNQYEMAKAINPDIKTVIMTAGGNDIILNGYNPCTTPPASAACIERLDAIAERSVELWTEMASDGVQDVIYIQYSRGGLTNEPGVTYANTQGIINDCKKIPICNYIDSDTLMNKDLMADGVHPTMGACDKLAAGIIDLMDKEGMRR